MTNSLIDYPTHYTNGMEPIDFIESQNFGFHEGQVLKYLTRYRYKGDPLNDLLKARWYLERLISIVEQEAFGKDEEKLPRAEFTPPTSDDGPEEESRRKSAVERFRALFTGK